MLHCSACMLLMRRSAASAALVRTPWLSSSLTAPQEPSGSPYVVLNTQYRHKAQRIRIANRKKVEMFVGTRFHLPTRLRTAAPDIAAEWDYERNPGHEYPEIIGIGHMAPVWWKCGLCGHSYAMSVEKRVVRGGGCERCALATAAEQAEAEAEALQSPQSGATEEAEESKDSGDEPTPKRLLRTEDLLEGEVDPSMRSKRSTMLNMRTKY